MLFLDRLQNLVTGLGLGKDKTTGASFALVPRNVAELEAAYRGDWLARKVVDIVPFDMTRAWRTWKALGPEIEAIEAQEKALGLRHKVNRAMSLARLYGGAVIVVGDGSQNSTEELRPEAMRAGALRWLHVLGRHEITAGPVDMNPASAYYGEPIHYERSTQSGLVRIHPSRVIRFVGAAYPRSDMADGWGDSILQALHDALMQAASVQQHVAAMIPEAKTDVVSVPSLSDHLSTAESTTKLTERFQYAATAKSMFGMLLLEGNGKSPEGEVWQQKTINFASFPDLMRIYLQVAAGAADIPVTRLLGQSPSGLSSTGDADIRNYYDHLAARQNVELGPAMARLDELLIWSALGKRPASIWYEWAPLWQVTDKEKAEIAKSTAETAAIYAREALVPPDVLAAGVKGRLVEDGTFPGIEAAYDTAANVPPEDDEDALTERAGETPPAEARRLRVAANDAVPRPLYVRRDVKNGVDILAWAKRQGFTTTLSADDLHVTIAFSRAPVDWMAVGESWEDEIRIAAGGPRVMEQFGEATVLLIPGRSLKWRHEEMKEAGASWDHPEYQPHITISYGGAPADLSAVEAYQGEIVLGPEVFEELEEGWRA